MDKKLFLDNLDLFARSRMMLVGYYSLMPNLEGDLPEVLAAIRKTGCRTALDAAGDGGTMQPLDRILPHVDVYVPSLDEAIHQTGHEDPRKIVDAYRACGAPGLLGVKLGSNGAMLSPAAGEYLSIAAVQPPGAVVDTTGAGDCFFAGLLTGLLKGLDAERSGRLAAATGACCVTGYGATTGLRGYRCNHPARGGIETTFFRILKHSPDWPRGMTFIPVPGALKSCRWQGIAGDRPRSPLPLTHSGRNGIFPVRCARQRISMRADRRALGMADGRSRTTRCRMTVNAWMRMGSRPI